MRSWARANRRRRKKPPRCPTCRQPILKHEPDILLQRLDTGEKLFFHTRCAIGALSALMLEPDMWFFAVRHVEEWAN